MPRPIPTTIWRDRRPGSLVIKVVYHDQDPITGHLQVTEDESAAEWMSVSWRDPVTLEEGALMEPYRPGVTQMVIHEGKLHVMLRPSAQLPYLWEPLYLADDGTGWDDLYDLEAYPGAVNILQVATDANGDDDVGGTPAAEKILFLRTLDQGVNDFDTLVEFV